MNQKERIKEKITFSFLIDLVLIKQTFLQGCFESFQCSDGKKNTIKTIIRHLFFDNFPRLTYPDQQISLINCLIFMLKYSILVLEQGDWLFTQKTRKKILIKKVARIFSLSLSLLPSLYININRPTSFRLQYYIYYKINKMFLWQKLLQEHVFATFWPILEKLNQGRNNVKTKLMINGR